MKELAKKAVFRPWRLGLCLGALAGLLLFAAPAAQAQGDLDLGDGASGDDETAEVVVPTAKELGAPLYKGAEPVSAVNKKDAVYRVKLFVDASPKKVSKFYRKKLKKRPSKTKIDGFDTKAFVLAPAAEEGQNPAHYVHVEERDKKSCYVVIHHDVAAAAAAKKSKKKKRKK